MSITINIKQKHVLIGLIITLFLVGIITVSAMSGNNSSITEQKHYSEANCNVDDHHVSGIHYHDTDNCTNDDHNHNTVNNHHNNNKKKNCGHH